MRANVLLNEENKSQREAAARKCEPEARRASAGQPWATVCHTGGTTLEGRISGPLLHAAACPAALDRLAGRCRPCSSSYLQRARENNSECRGCGGSCTGRWRCTLCVEHVDASELVDREHRRHDGGDQRQSLGQHVGRPAAAAAVATQGWTPRGNSCAPERVHGGGRISLQSMSDCTAAHSTMPCVPPASVRLAPAPRRARHVPFLTRIAQMSVL